MLFPAPTLLNLLVIAVSGLAGAIPMTPPAPAPEGFVTTEGHKFKLDGEDFYFAGTNAYYLPFMDNITDVELGLTAAKAAGLKVIRTWGFNEKNTTFNPNGFPKYGGEGAGPASVYFRSWTNGTAEINYGPTGLEAFDRIVEVAEELCLKLVVTLTNNWADYGGMDVSTTNLGGKYHDDFYHVPEIVDSYKDYINVFVSRYKSSPAIMAWQLANEPRCGADTARNLPPSPACNATMMTNWIKDISSYIKEIDPCHLVSVGGEGWFNFPGNPDSSYSSNNGDFYAELGVDTVDYGTFHLYPDWWGKTSAWGTQWIKDHAIAQEKMGKPVVFEEYGWMTDAARLEYLGKVSNETRLEVVGKWQNTSVNTMLAGDQYWQFGYSNFSFGRNNDDGFTIYLDDPEAKQLVYQHAERMDKRNRVHRLTK